MTESEEDMKRSVESGVPARRQGNSSSVAAAASGSCFPYGVLKRIRFEGFEDGTCPLLSPAPQALLNEVGWNEARKAAGLKLKVG